VIAVPIAFLAKDQIEFGVRRGEQTTLLTIFALALASFVTVGKTPVGSLVVVAVLFVIMRRTALYDEDRSAKRGWNAQL
jgi:hypothetical protein